VKALTLILLLGIAPRIYADDTLSLNQALQMARERNDTVKAACFALQAARAGTDRARSAYFPSLTPQYQYLSDRQQLLTPGKPFVQNEGGSTTVTAAWRLLDSGQRDLSLLSSRRSEDATEASARETLRQTLFGVYGQYLEALRAQELLRVDESQVGRANTILDQTKARVEVGDLARKEILQAKADALNAQVAYLQTKNRSSNALASLKSLIGWEQAAPLPKLELIQAGELPPLPSMDTLIRDGLEHRMDLISSRLSLESLRYDQRLAERNAGPNLGLDASFTKTLTPATLENRALTLTVTGPFFDGGAARASARQARYQYLGAKATYDQKVRDAKAEIEAAYEAVSENNERMAAASSAREAAQQNYDAASEAQRLGAGTLIDVLTAQVSLITAESNYIQAVYDFALSKVKLDLVTGKPIPGEGPLCPL
jgi:outer membrane protein